MSDLAAFLLVRIEEDERWAGVNQSGRRKPGRWPSWVLAECASKRRVMEHHSARPSAASAGFACGWCGMHWPCFDLRNAASAYADHPDFREEWRG